MKSVPLPVGALVRRLSGLPPSAVAGHTHAEMKRGEEIRRFHQISFQFEAKPTGKTLRALSSTHIGDIYAVQCLSFLCYLPLPLRSIFYLSI